MKISLFLLYSISSFRIQKVSGSKKKGKEKLISFDEALKRCQDPHWMSRLHGGKALVLSNCQRKSIKLLKQVLRNNFEHYTPKLWSIEVHGLPQIALDIIYVIHFLVIENSIYINLNSSQIHKAKSVVYQRKLFLKKSKLYKEGLQY